MSHLNYLKAGIIQNVRQGHPDENFVFNIEDKRARLWFWHAG